MNSTNRSSRTSTTSSDSFATSSGDEPKNLPARCRAAWLQVTFTLKLI